MKEKKEALLVIDMQNVYLPGNSWCCKNIATVIDYIKEIIKKFNKEDIFFTGFISSKNPSGRWKIYNDNYKQINENVYYNEIIDDLRCFITKDNFYEKSTFSAIKNNDLYNKLKDYETVYITGVVAECCVLSTIFELIDSGIKVVYCKNGIAGINEKKEECVIEILKDLVPIHVEIEK